MTPTRNDYYERRARLRDNLPYFEALSDEYQKAKVVLLAHSSDLQLPEEEARYLRDRVRECYHALCHLHSAWVVLMTDVRAIRLPKIKEEAF